MGTGDIVALAIVGTAIFAGCMGWLRWLSDIKTGILVAVLALWIISLLNTWGWFRQATDDAFSKGVIVPYISRKLEMEPATDDKAAPQPSVAQGMWNR